MGFGLGVPAPSPEMIVVRPTVKRMLHGTGVSVIMDPHTNRNGDSAQSVATLDHEMAAYRQQAARLEATQAGKWVIFKGSALVGTHETFEQAARDAVRRFGRGPYLIRQVGAPPIVIPVSLAYSPGNEDHH